MLAVTTVNNTESTVYTVPSGKQGFIELFVWVTGACTLTIKLNNVTFFSYAFSDADLFQTKVALTAGDTIRVGTTGTVNVFVTGMEV